MPMRHPPEESLPSPGVTTPGQFGPIRRVCFPSIARLTLTMSLTGMPSVMQTTTSKPASTPSRMASAAQGGEILVSACGLLGVNDSIEVEKLKTAIGEFAFYATHQSLPVVADPRDFTETV